MHSGRNFVNLKYMNRELLIMCGIDEFKSIAKKKYIMKLLNSGTTIRQCNEKIESIENDMKLYYRSLNFQGHRETKEQKDYINNKRKLLSLYNSLRKRFKKSNLEYNKV